MLVNERRKLQALHTLVLLSIYSMYSQQRTRAYKLNRRCREKAVGQEEHLGIAVQRVLYTLSACGCLLSQHEYTKSSPFISKVRIKQIIDNYITVDPDPSACHK